MSEPTIDLYTAQTPNGIKISITLEELGLKYNVHKLNFSKQEQKAPDFLKVNPNGRIPGLTDTFTDGKQIRLFESGSIMQYLVERYDKDHKISYPAGSREHYETNNWLFFQNAGLGPMQGQAHHFLRYAPEKVQYGMDRYKNETWRLYSVLEKHLQSEKSEYLVGNKLTIADIAVWGWVAVSQWAGVKLDDFPALKEWEERVLKRPAVERGRHVPSQHDARELSRDEEKSKAWAAENSAWIMKGQEQDAKRKL